MGIKLQGQVSWVLTVIYTNPHSHIRDWLWQELQGFAIDCMKPWLLAGDYNETISLEECNHGGPDMRRRCNRFKQWIENNGLIDLGYSGPKFTWARGLPHDTQKEARLDRALCNDTWRVKFLEGAVRHLLQAGSDHSTVVDIDWGFYQATIVQYPVSLPSGVDNSFHV